MGAARLTATFTLPPAAVMLVTETRGGPMNKQSTMRSLWPQFSAGKRFRASAKQFEDGLAAYQHGDYATALRLLRPVAEKGNPQAQAYLGFMYIEGRGVPQDDAEAAKWLRLAAEQGYAEAQSNLGVIYIEGRGVPQDDAEAVKWLRLAAEQGYAEAQSNLGVMYAEGQGVPKDLEQALTWFIIGDALGEKEAKRGQDYATNLMTSDQIAKAQRMARKWMAKHQRRRLRLNLL